MTSVTLNVMIMSAFAMIVIVCGNPVDSNVESEIIICPEGVTNGGETWNKFSSQLCQFFVCYWLGSQSITEISLLFLLNNRDGF